MRRRLQVGGGGGFSVEDDGKTGKGVRRVGGGVGTGKGTGKSMHMRLSKLTFSKPPLSFSPNLGPFWSSTPSDSTTAAPYHPFQNHHTHEIIIFEFHACNRGV